MPLVVDGDDINRFYVQALTWVRALEQPTQPVFPNSIGQMLNQGGVPRPIRLCSHARVSYRYQASRFPS